MNIYGFKTKKSIYDIVTRRGGKMRTFQEALEVKNPRRKASFKINVVVCSCLLQQFWNAKKI